MYEPFLTWLYEQARKHAKCLPPELLDMLPAHVDLADAPFAWSGYRRPGAASVGSLPSV